jgi:hypothetical protein
MRASVRSRPSICIVSKRGGLSRRLTVDQRRAVELRYSRPELVPLAEVATRMGRSEGAVKLLLHRAVGALRRAMADLELAETAPRVSALPSHAPRKELLN